jgi:metallo-beta-lactamase class B
MSMKRMMMLGAAGLAACLYLDTGVAMAADAAEPYSKTCRVTRARDNSIQKQEPFKAFDNLYYVGPCFVSVWLLTTPQGNILFDSAQEPFVDDVIANIRKVGVNLRDIKYIVLSHGHLDHAGGAARLQEVTGARVVALAEDWDMIAALDGKPGNRDPKPNKVPKRDMVVKEGDTLDLGGQHLLFHHQPGHTPGVLTTEGITVFDNGKPYRAILMGGAGYRGGVKEAQQSVETAAQIAKFQGVQVNLQIHSWSGPNGYLRGGVLERSFKIKDRKPGDPNPFVDPEAWTDSVKRTQAQAAKDLETEKQKAAAK